VKRENEFSLQSFLSLSLFVLFFTIFIFLTFIIVDGIKTFRYIDYSKNSFLRLQRIDEILLCLTNEKNQIFINPILYKDILYNTTDISIDEIIKKNAKKKISNVLFKQYTDLKDDLVNLRINTINKAPNAIYMDYVRFIGEKSELYAYSIDMPTTRGIGARILSIYDFNNLEYNFEQFTYYLENVNFDDYDSQILFLLFNKAFNTLKIVLNSPSFSLSEETAQSIEKIKENEAYILMDELFSFSLDEVTRSLQNNDELILKFRDEIKQIVFKEEIVISNYIDTQLTKQYRILSLLVVVYLLLIFVLFYLFVFFSKNIFNPLSYLTTAIKNFSFDEIELKKIKGNEFRKFASLLLEYNKQNIELLNNKNELKAISEHTYSWEFWIDNYGSLKYVSPSCEKVIGYTAKEFLDQKDLMKEIVYFEDRDMFGYHDCLPKQHENHIDIRFVHKNGDVKWFSHVCRKIYSDDVCIGIRGVNFDINDRKLLENRLTDTLQMYHSLINASPDAICVTDSTGKIIFASQILFKLLEIKKYDDLIGKDLINWISEDYKCQYNDNLHTIMTSKKAIKANFEIQSANNGSLSSENKRVLVNINSAPIVKDNNRIDKIISIIREENKENLILYNDENRKINIQLKNDAKDKEYERDSFPTKSNTVHNNEDINILLVEDSYVNRALIIEMLHSTNWKLFTAENGEIAIKVFKENPIDIILMDIQMPIMDGYEATKIIKGLQRKLNVFVPIIALTAHVMVGDKEKCLNVGMDDYLSKPIEYITLKSMCEKWIDKKFKK